MQIDRRETSALVLSRWPHLLAANAAVCALYFAAARFGLSLAFETRQVTAIWPPTGIALASLLLLGLRVWPGIYLGGFAINALVGDSTLAAAGIAIGNTLGPVLAALALTRVLHFDRRLQRLRDVLALIVAGAMLTALVTATNGVLQLTLGGVVTWSSFGSVWSVWWMGDAMGVLVVAPLILSVVLPAIMPSRAQPSAGAFELACLLCVLVLTSIPALNGVSAGPSPFQLQYAVFPWVIWSALRFRMRETSLCIAIINGLAVWGATRDRGPFASGNLDHRLLLLEMFMAVIAVTGLILTATMSERTAALRALQNANDDLEQRVSERTAELAATNRVLERKNEEVEAFVYVVSHDLRAPLVNLQGFSAELSRSSRELEQALTAVPLPAATRQHIHTILHEDIAKSLSFIGASATKFKRLIDALLLLSRTGKQELHLEPVEMRDVVQATIDTLHNSIDRARVEVHVDPLPRALADMTAVGQIFSNLISNALKYLDPGRPGRLGVGGEAHDGVAHYWVSDNGSGIPPSSLPRLFQVFQRFHPELASGEGMGLAIVKRVVERHGGKIWVESAEGIGSTFHFTLTADTRERNA